jgi:hypothetical protein
LQDCPSGHSLLRCPVSCFHAPFGDFWPSWDLGFSARTKRPLVSHSLLLGLFPPISRYNLDTGCSWHHGFTRDKNQETAPFLLEGEGENSRCFGSSCERATLRIKAGPWACQARATLLSYDPNPGRNKYCWGVGGGRRHPLLPGSHLLSRACHPKPGLQA